MRFEPSLWTLLPVFYHEALTIEPDFFPVNLNSLNISNALIKSSSKMLLNFTTWSSILIPSLCLFQQLCVLFKPPSLFPEFAAIIRVVQSWRSSSCLRNARHSHRSNKFILVAEISILQNLLLSLLLSLFHKVYFPISFFSTIICETRLQTRDEKSGSPWINILN